MNKKMIALNNQINKMLINSYKLEKELEKKDPQMASNVRRISSNIAYQMIQESGLQKAIREFYKEQKGLAYETI